MRILVEQIPEARDTDSAMQPLPDYQAQIRGLRAVVLVFALAAIALQFAAAWKAMDERTPAAAPPADMRGAAGF